MTTLWSETWAYSNGTSPTTVTTGETGTGSTATVQSNALRLTSGTTAGGPGKISRRANMTAVTDVEVTGSVTMTATAGDYTASVLVRSENAADGQNGYSLDVWNNGGTVQWEVVRNVNYTSTNLLTIGTNGLTATYGSVVNYRFRVIGAHVQARVWTGGTEPGTWGLDVTDGSPYSSSGAVAWAQANNDGTARAVALGATTITDGTSSTLAATGTATVTLTGTATARAAATGHGALTLVASNSAGSSFPEHVIVAGVKKTVTGLWVVVGGVKKTVTGVSAIVGGVKKTPA